MDSNFCLKCGFLSANQQCHFSCCSNCGYSVNTYAEGIEVHSFDNKVKVFCDAFNKPKNYVELRLQDARVASPLAESYCEDIPWFGGNGKFRYCDDKGNDGYIKKEKKHIKEKNEAKHYLWVSEIEKYFTQIKCIGSSGVKFQLSSKVGSGRDCSDNDLLNAVEQVDYYIIVDIYNLNKWSYYLVPSRLIRKAHEDGKLRTSGWSRDKFLSWIANYNYTIHNLKTIN